MKLGLVGLGRMGANIGVKLIEAGHGIIAFDRIPANTQTLVGKGAVGATSVERICPETGSAPRRLADGAGRRRGRHGGTTPGRCSLATT